MKKENTSTAILILAFLVGLSLLLYPSVSDYWNSFHQTRAIVQYSQDVAQIDNERYKALWQAAEDYNAALRQNKARYLPTDEEKAQYNGLLNVSGSGIMGSIEIPSIDCNLPLYHGTEEMVLQIAVGHIEGSSLPVGGKGSHCALSGHRGLPSAKLFTDLDRLDRGDVFMLNILDETLTYEVDQILIVEPYEMDALEIDPEEDYCTLVTCTPYGINSHRLLVRGHRIENLTDSHNVRVSADAVQIEPVIVAPLVALPMLLILLILLLLPKRPHKNGGGAPDEND